MSMPVPAQQNCSEKKTLAGQGLRRNYALPYGTACGRQFIFLEKVLRKEHILSS